MTQCFLEQKRYAFLNELFYNISTDIEEDFLKVVRKLVPYVIPANKVTPKRMNGKNVKGKEMLSYIKVRIKSHFLKKIHLSTRHAGTNCFINLSLSGKKPVCFPFHLSLYSIHLLE